MSAGAGDAWRRQSDEFITSSFKLFPFCLILWRCCKFCRNEKNDVKWNSVEHLCKAIQTSARLSENVLHQISIRKAKFCKTQGLFFLKKKKKIPAVFFAFDNSFWADQTSVASLTVLRSEESFRGAAGRWRSCTEGSRKSRKMRKPRSLASFPWNL